MTKRGWTLVAVAATLTIVGTAGASRNDRATTAKAKAHSAQDQRGPRGPRGPRGRRGPAGPQGLLSTIVTATATKVVPPGVVDYVVATCPSGTLPISGGGTFTGVGGIFIHARSGSGWAIGGDNFNGVINGDLTAYAYCAAGVQIQGLSAPANLRALVDSKLGADQSAR